MKQLHAVKSPADTNRLGTLSWEERRGLSAAELIQLMGPAWAGHPKFVAKPRSLIPLENLARRRPSAVAELVSFRQLWHWVRALVLG